MDGCCWWIDRPWHEVQHLLVPRKGLPWDHPLVLHTLWEHLRPLLLGGATQEYMRRASLMPTRTGGFVVMPHAMEAAFAREVMREVVGESQALEQEPTMGAEDFAFMLQARPGAYLFIGNGEGTHRRHYEGTGHDAGPCTLHNPRYDFNDELIPVGASYWVELVRRWLAR